MQRVSRVRVSCTACDKEIEKYPAQVAQSKTGRFFCSVACRNAVGGKPRTVARKTCELCGVELVAYGDRAGRFCSKDCYDEWQRRRRVHKVCEFCGKDFWLKPSQAEHNVTGRWCSRACEATARIKRPLDRMHNGKPAVLDRQGYVRIFEPEHPRATKSGWVFEHRFIAETRIGRLLRQDEHVHHVNGQKADNRPENLVVMGHSEHSTLTVKERAEALAAQEAELDEYRRRFGPL